MTERIPQGQQVPQVPVAPQPADAGYQPQYVASAPVPQAAQPVTDSGSFGWAVLSFFIPIVGLVLFLVWKQTKPKCAKMAGIGALVGVIAAIVLNIITFSIAMFTTPYYY